LPPLSILLGKLLGEPAIGYLLTIATFPLAFLCWLWGAVSFDVLLLAYFNIATTTLMLGTLSMRTELALGDSPMTGKLNAKNLLVLLYIMPFGCFILYGAILANIASVPWASALMGLFLPITALYGISTDNPYIGISFFGRELPCLIVTPFVQLFITFWCLRT